MNQVSGMGLTPILYTPELRALTPFNTSHLVISKIFNFFLNQ